MHNPKRAHQVPPRGNHCWECKKKRLVCDELKPYCQKCKSRDIDCPGYDHKPLVWIPNGQVKSNGRRHCQTLLALRPAPYSNETSLGICRRLEVITYYNSYIAPEAVCCADAWGPGGKPAIPMDLARVMPDSVSYSLACIVIGHRILQSQNGAYQLRLSHLLRDCRSKAIRAITTQLGTRNPARGDGTLWAVLLLFLADVQQAVTYDWRPHLDGADTLISIRGGLSTFISSPINFKQMILYYMLADVMGRTTSPSMSINKATSHLQLIQLLPELYHDGLRTSCPCPPELFESIILINYHRSLMNDIDAAESVRRQTAMVLLDKINSFSPEKWGNEAAVAQFSNNILDKENNGPHASLSGWLCVASAYQCAVALYCLGSLLNGHAEEGIIDTANPRISDGVGVSQNGMQKAYLNVLLHQLTEMMCPDIAAGFQFGKLVVWPLVIAGMALPQNDERSKRFIKHQLNLAGAILGTSSTLVAVRVLEQIWMSSRACHRRLWDEVFDKSYIFVI